MSHVKIYPRPESGGYNVEIDGHNIGDVIAHDGLEISFEARELTRRMADARGTARKIVPTVTMTLAEGVDLDLRLPDALVSLIVQPERDEQQQ